MSALRVPHALGGSAAFPMGRFRYRHSRRARQASCANRPGAGCTRAGNDYTYDCTVSPIRERPPPDFPPWTLARSFRKHCSRLRTLLYCFHLWFSQQKHLCFYNTGMDSPSISDNKTEIAFSFPNSLMRHFILQVEHPSLFAQPETESPFPAQTRMASVRTPVFSIVNAR